MKDKSMFRGNKMKFVNDVWIYADDNKLVSEDLNRLCGHCNMERTKKGHDACLGNLKGVMNACCGHGVFEEAYLQFLDGVCVYGEEAITIMNFLKRRKK